jgi:flagellar hook protein FlgE
MESLYTAVSGMSANARAIDVIANNISNVNTVGFKKSKVFFKDVFYKTLRYATPPSSATDLGGVNPSQSGLGTAVSAINKIFTQGTMETTEVASNVALMGDGLFVVGNNDDPRDIRYTRDGSFNLDSENMLVSGAGHYVLGWTASQNASGDMTIDTSQSITRLNIPIGQEAKAKATTRLEFNGNLDQTTPTGGTYRTNIVLYDSLGNDHTLYFTFTKTATNNQWTWAASKYPPNYNFGSVGPPPVAPDPDPDPAISQPFVVGTPAAPLGTGTITYDAFGQYLSSNPAQSVSLTLTNGSNTPQNVTLDLANTTQLDVADIEGNPNSNVTVKYQNGYPMGTLTNYSIGLDGTISGIYSNGITELVGALAVASFRNPVGLEQIGDNQFVPTSNSGQPSYGLARTDGRGSVYAGSVENSNVDVADEFVKLIVTQRAFQANTRVITTSDDMLQEVLNLRK